MTSQSDRVPVTEQGNLASDDVDDVDDVIVNEEIVTTNVEEGRLGRADVGADN
jgi:hypothetical protein